MKDSYDDLKETDSPWLGPVPRHWTVSRLRYEATISGGQVDPRDAPWNSMILIAPNHLESGTGRILATETASEQGADSGKYVVRPGQIVYSKIRPALNKAAIVNIDALCSADMYALTFRTTVDSRFALYYLLARPVHVFATVTSMRVKMPKINREELADVPWLVPPITEQRSIADFLDRETARMDLLIEEQRRLVQIQQERRQAVVDTAVFGLEEHAPVRRVKAIGNHDAVEPLLSRLPATWYIVRFKTALTRLDERNVDLRYEMMSLRSTGEVVARASLGERQEPDSSNLPKYLVAHMGDLIVNPMWLVGGAIGVSTADGAVSPDYRVFRSTEIHHPRYLHHLLRSRPYLDQYLLYTRAQTTFDRRVQQPDLDNLPLPVPPFDEQVRIAEHIDVEAAKIDDLIAETERFIELSRERRSALITSAVTGQIDVRDEGA